MENKKPDFSPFGFACRVERSGDMIKLTCEVKRYEEERGINCPRGVCGLGHGSELDGLTVSTMLFPDRREEGLIYTEFRFGYAQSFTLHDAEQIVKVLTKVEKGVERLRRQLGREQGIAQYIGRVSAALGFGRAWVYNESSHWSGWMGFDEIGVAVDSVRMMIDREYDKAQPVEIEDGQEAIAS